MAKVFIQQIPASMSDMFLFEWRYATNSFIVKLNDNYAPNNIIEFIVKTISSILDIVIFKYQGYRCIE